jgi:hypothetical protein
MQDWPQSETHFAQGVRRLTRIQIGENLHVPLTDDRIFEYPWAYATQVGYWNLSDAEVSRLREYLLRGGFLVVDDFWGMDEWVVFRDSMERVRDAVERIEGSLRQQTDACRRAVSFLEQIHERTRSHEEATRRMSEATLGLKTQAEALRQDVRRFRI